MIRRLCLCLAVGALLNLSCGGSASVPAFQVTLQTSLGFGQVPTGSQSPQLAVTIINSGASAFTFSSTPTITGVHADQFSIASTTCSTSTPLAVSAGCSVTLIYTPANTSDATATLNFSISGASNSVSVALSGRGVAAVTNVLPGQVVLASTNNVNLFFVTLTICVPGTSTCQTIPNVEVDTGSSGLRLLSSAVSIPLIQALTSSGQSLANCVQFADMSYAFGPVKNADIRLSGEVALNQPIQIMGDTSFAPTPSGPTGCVVPGGSALTTNASLGANGILGIGLFKEDCGSACAVNAIPGTYYACTGSSCSPTTASLASQLKNPVWQFNQDNNGFLFSLDSVPAAGANAVQGQIIFGINTKANNNLGSATIYTANAIGNISTTYNGMSYPSFIDSGSNGLFFLSDVSTGLMNCSSAQGFYCPPSSTSFSVINTGQNGKTGTVTFNIGNAEALFTANPSHAAFNNIGGPFPNVFDFGLPFFFGRTIYFGIEDQSVATEVGPLYAY